MRKVIAFLALSFVLFVPKVLYNTGTGLNQVVIQSNDQQMPMKYASGLCDDDQTNWNHSCETSATKFKLLDDRIIGNSGVCSVGDLLIDVGEDPQTYLNCVVVFGLGMVLLIINEVKRKCSA